jgi:ornithine--oxo-acid transaminase
MSKITTTIGKMSRYCAKNYKSTPKVFTYASNIYLFDSHDKSYYDFLAGYGAINQGHCHPQILYEMTKQANKLTLTSRACHNPVLADFSEKITRMFGYDKVLPTNTGCEAGETAVKIARAWGYMKKGILQNKAHVVFAENNFWGRSIAACSSSTDPSCYNNYGPYTSGFSIVPYNNITALEKEFSTNPNICGFMFEPIQGEAGVIIPDPDYIKKVRDLCSRYNVLMIADEVQTGIGRTGELYECKSHNLNPDILCLGKALGGGFLPISAVLANDYVMDCISPGTHGSTFGGNPLACAVSMASLDIINKEQLSKNARIMGKLFRNYFSENIDKYPFSINVRGQGLMNAIEFENSSIAQVVSERLLDNNVFAKVTRDNIIRFTPPLTISKHQMEDAIEKIDISIKSI